MSARRSLAPVSLSLSLSLLLVGASLSSTNARASEVSEAQRAYAEVEYATCVQRAKAALDQPGTRTERVDAWRYLGLCHAALGETDAAREAWRQLLSIDRDAKLPEGLSPRFTSAFREAKGSLVDTAPLAMRIERDEDIDGVRTLRVALDDGAGLVSKIAWRGEGGVLSPSVRAAAKLELQVAPGDVTVVGLDKAGGELVTALAAAQKAPEVVAAPVAPVNEDDGGGGTFVIIAAAAGGALLVGAGIAAVIAYSYLAPPGQVVIKTDVVFE